MISITDFHIVRNDRNLENFHNLDIAGGGGVITYINKNWCKNCPTIFKAVSLPDAEILVIVARPLFLPNKFKSIVNINIYLRPQRKKIQSDKIIRETLQDIYKKHPFAFIILTGDANDSNIKAAEDFSLSNIINCPTFYPTQSQLDVAYITNPDLYYYDMSHHIGNASTMFHLSFYLIPNKTNFNKTRNKTKESKEINYENFTDAINLTNWNVFNSNNNANELASTVDSYLEFLIESHSTFTKYTEDSFLLRIRNNDDLKSLSKVKFRAIKDGDKHLRNQIQRKITHTVKSMRQNYLKSLHSKQLYQVARTLQKGETRTQLPDMESAENLNKYFTRFNDNLNKDVALNFDLFDNHSDDTELITVNQVKLLLQNIRISSSSGPSKIPCSLLKKCSSSLSVVYTKIFNECISQKTYPNIWKSAHVTACPKTSQYDFSNPKIFRPIAVTPMLARIFDRIILSKLENLMMDTEDKHQYAYKNGYSTIDALISLTHFIHQKLDTSPNSIVKCVFLDYSSAFNTVLQNQLLNIIAQKSTNISCLLHNYMSDWNQAVKAKHQKTSSKINVTVGIPQGGPLSAKLFTYITNSINSDTLNLKSHRGILIKYSDDTCYSQNFNSNQSIECQSNYEETLSRIAALSDERNLNLNVAKCEELVICYKSTNTNEAENIANKRVNLNGSLLPRVDKVKYLGIFISKSLDWTDHVNYLVRKANYTILTLSKFFPYLDKKTKIMFYKSLILSNLLYGSEVWGTGLKEKDKKKIKKVIKFISKVTSISSDELLTILNDTYKNKFKSIVHKILNDQSHPLNHIFSTMKSSTNNTRNGWLNMYTRTEKYSHSFIPQALLYLSNNVLPNFL